MRLESKIGSIPHTDERIYNFLTDFNNFRDLIPKDKLQDWNADETSCSFTISPLGRTGVKIIEDSSYNFVFWVQLKAMTENDTRIKLTLDAELNSMIEMMARKPLQEFLDKLVDQLAKFSY